MLNELLNNFAWNRLSLTMIQFKEIVRSKNKLEWTLVTRFEALSRNNAMKLLLAHGTAQGKYKTVRVS